LAVSQSAAAVQLFLQDILVASHRYPMHIVALAGVQVPVPSQDPKPVNVVVPAGHDCVPQGVPPD
jgi:hypothetical protein